MADSGIPNGSRARPVLFQGKSLQKSTTAYPNIGQKKLNGASSRMMVFFAAMISEEIAESHEKETYRFGLGFGFEKRKGFRSLRKFKVC